jgi:hypothetical protein
VGDTAAPWSALMSRPGLLFDPTLEQILDLARWAPSGDNTQPWRFEILGPRRLIVHGHDTRNHCVYDLDGHPSQLSLGALLETMSIAASRFRLQLHASRHTEAPEQHPRFSIDLLPAPCWKPMHWPISSRPAACSGVP